MDRWRPQSSIAVVFEASVVGYPKRKSAYGKPDPTAFELELKVEAKTYPPGLPFRTSNRSRRRSTPAFTVCRPCVQFRLSDHWNRFSTLRLGSPPPQPLNSAEPETVPA